MLPSLPKENKNLLSFCFDYYNLIMLLKLTLISFYSDVSNKSLAILSYILIWPKFVPVKIKSLSESYITQLSIELEISIL